MSSSCHVELVETSHIMLSMRYVRSLGYARDDRAKPLKKNPCYPRHLRMKNETARYIILFLYTYLI